MDAELAPFMRGEFLIFDMRLHKPVMVIDVADNGLIDWTMRPNTPFDASQVKLEKISVTEGSIAIRHAAGGRDHKLTASMPISRHVRWLAHGGSTARLNSMVCRPVSPFPPEP